MKRALRVMLLGLLTFSFLSSYANAQLAKEGTFSGNAVGSVTFKALAMGEERVQLDYEFMGAFLNDGNEGFLHKASFHDMGALHSVNGIMEYDHSFCVFADKDGDKVFLTHQATGSMDSAKRIWKWVGSTGKYTGIQGGGEWNWVSTPPVAEGTVQGLWEMKGDWKLP
jgi:hypothetical protein